MVTVPYPGYNKESQFSRATLWLVSIEFALQL